MYSQKYETNVTFSPDDGELRFVSIHDYYCFTVLDLSPYFFVSPAEHFHLRIFLMHKPESSRFMTVLPISEPSPCFFFFFFFFLSPSKHFSFEIFFFNLSWVPFRWGRLRVKTCRNRSYTLICLTNHKTRCANTPTIITCMLHQFAQMLNNIRFCVTRFLAKV